MVQQLYRIQWKDTEGRWRYVNGAIILKVMGSDFARLLKDGDAMKDKPYLFTEKVTAEHVARAMTDLKDVGKVELREESTILTLVGAGWKEGDEKK